VLARVRGSRGCNCIKGWWHGAWWET
jgi:hypothetical protein